MKKKTIIILSVIAILLTAGGIFGYNIWKKYINPVITATKYTEEELKAATDDKKLIEEITGLEIRDFSEEEKTAIEKGEKKESEVMEEIIKEAITEREKELEEETASASGTDATGSEKEQGKITKKDNKDGNKKPSAQSGKDSSGKKPVQVDSAVITAKYLSELYALQGYYSGIIEGMIPQAKEYYYHLRKVQKYDKESAIAATSKAYLGKANGAEAECDAKVNSVISRLEQELKANGHPTDIISTIKSRYESEKTAKRAYYVKLFMGS